MEQEVGRHPTPNQSASPSQRDEAADHFAADVADSPWVSASNLRILWP